MDFLNEEVKPLFFRNLVPAFGGAAGACVFSMIDALMVGQYHGAAGSAALAVYTPLWTVLYCLSLMVMMGGATLFAHARGRGDEKDAQAWFSASVWYGALLSALITVCFCVFSDPIFRFFGADGELLPLVKAYFAPIRFALPFCFFRDILVAFVRNDGEPGLGLKAAIIGGVLNVVLDYLCIFVWDMGIGGAGLATAIALSVTTLILLVHFFRKNNTLKLGRAPGFWRRAGRISVLGFASGIADLALGSVGVLFNRAAMAYFGTETLAVFGVVNQVTILAQNGAYGLGEAAQPILSQNLAAGKKARVRKCLRLSLVTGVLMGVFWCVLLILIPVPLTRLFVKPTESLLAAAPKVMIPYAFSYLLLPLNIFLPYYFQSLLRPAVSLSASVLRSLVFSSLVILSVPVLFSPALLWWSMSLVELLTFLFQLFFLIRCTRRLDH